MAKLTTGAAGQSTKASSSEGDRASRLSEAARAYLKPKRGQPQPSIAALAQQFSVPYATLHGVIKRDSTAGSREDDAAGHDAAGHPPDKDNMLAAAAASMEGGKQQPAFKPWVPLTVDAAMLRVAAQRSAQPQPSLRVGSCSIAFKLSFLTAVLLKLCFCAHYSVVAMAIVLRSCGSATLKLPGCGRSSGLWGQPGTFSGPVCQTSVLDRKPGFAQDVAPAGAADGPQPSQQQTAGGDANNGQAEAIEQQGSAAIQMPVPPPMFSKEQYETAGYSPEQVEVAMKDQDQQWQAYQQKYQEYLEPYQKQQGAAASQQVVMYTAEQLYAAGWNPAQVEDRLRQQEIYQQQLQQFQQQAYEQKYKEAYQMQQATIASQRVPMYTAEQLRAAGWNPAQVEERLMQQVVYKRQLLQHLKQQAFSAGRLWNTWYTAMNPDNTIAHDPNGKPYLMYNEQYYYHNGTPLYSPTGNPLYDNGRDGEVWVLADKGGKEMLGTMSREVTNMAKLAGWLDCEEIGLVGQINATATAYSNTAMLLTETAAEARPWYARSTPATRQPARGLLKPQAEEGWSLADVQVVTSVGAVLHEMHQFQKELLVYLGHPAVAVPSQRDTLAALRANDMLERYHPALSLSPHSGPADLKKPCIQGLGSATPAHWVPRAGVAAALHLLHCPIFQLCFCAHYSVVAMAIVLQRCGSKTLKLSGCGRSSGLWGQPGTFSGPVCQTGELDRTGRRGRGHANTVFCLAAGPRAYARQPLLLGRFRSAWPRARRTSQLSAAQPGFAQDVAPAGAADGPQPSQQQTAGGDANNGQAVASEQQGSAAIQMPVAPTMFSKEQYETAGYSPEQLEVAMKDQDKQWQAYQQKYQEYVEAYQKQQAAAASQQVVMYTPEQLYAAGWTQAQVEDRLRQQEIYQQQLLDQQLLQRKQQAANAGRLWDTWYTATNPDNTIARDPNGRPYLMCNEQYYYYNRSPVYSPTGSPLYDNGREMYDAQGYPQPYEPTPVLQPQTYYPDNQMDYPNTQNWTALGRQARGPSSTHMPDEQLEYAEDLIMPAAREPQAKIPRLCYVNGKPVEDNESRNWREVRVLADEGGKEMLGTMSLEQATIMAQERGTDVIVLNPDLSTPLVRLWEWSKFKYEAEKDAKQKASKSTVVETKEVQLRPKTDSNDLATKMKSAIKFLEKGKKVRLVMKLEGRELQFRDSSKEVLMKFLADVEQVGKPEVDVNYKGGSYTVVLCPTGKKYIPPAPATPISAAAASDNSLLLPPPSPAAATSKVAPADKLAALPLPPPAPGAVQATVAAPAAAPVSASLPLPPEASQQAPAAVEQARQQAVGAEGAAVEVPEGKEALPREEKVRVAKAVEALDSIPAPANPAMAPAAAAAAVPLQATQAAAAAPAAAPAPAAAAASEPAAAEPAARPDTVPTTAFTATPMASVDPTTASIDKQHPEQQAAITPPANLPDSAAELPAPGGVAGAGQGTPSVAAAELAAEVESPAGSQNDHHLPSELPAATRAPEQRLEVAVAGVQAPQQEEVAAVAAAAASSAPAEDLTPAATAVAAAAGAVLTAAAKPTPAAAAAAAPGTATTAAAKGVKEFKLLHPAGAAKAVQAAQSPAALVRPSSAAAATSKPTTAPSLTRPTLLEVKRPVLASSPTSAAAATLAAKPKPAASGPAAPNKPAAGGTAIKPAGGAAVKPEAAASGTAAVKPAAVAGGAAAGKPAAAAGGVAAVKPAAAAGGVAAGKPAAAAGGAAAVKPGAAAGGAAAVKPEATAGGAAAVKPAAAAGGVAAVKPEATAGGAAAVEPAAVAGGAAAGKSVATANGVSAVKPSAAAGGVAAVKPEATAGGAAAVEPAAEAGGAAAVKPAAAAGGATAKPVAAVATGTAAKPGAAQQAVAPVKPVPVTKAEKPTAPAAAAQAVAPNPPGTSSKPTAATAAAPQKPQPQAPAQPPAKPQQGKQGSQEQQAAGATPTPQPAAVTAPAATPPKATPPKLSPSEAAKKLLEAAKASKQSTAKATPPALAPPTRPAASPASPARKPSPPKARGPSTPPAAAAAAPAAAPAMVGVSSEPAQR
ncbi:hypothetical protein QJQ45_014405 [Haematococcus lacustris]|nr:hypothetical protein QJQ45_014405 [Haematococcus lacustris]